MKKIICNKNLKKYIIHIRHITNRNKTLSNKIKLFIVIYLIFIYTKIFKIEIININKVPKVSVFLPIFNKAFFLKESIKSIQKQSLKDIEIIAVNDCSTDNTLNILKKLAKKDKRIKIVNNDRNHGLLYSRAMGILNSTGEFVMNLDPDDRFIGVNNLKFLYYNSKKFKLDLIEFLLKRFNITNIQILNEYLKNFKEYPNISSKKEIDILITNKFMKRDIIIKAFNFYKKKIYSNKWNYHEDHIWHFLINKYSKSRIFIYKYIYLYIINNQSLMNNRHNLLELKNIIYKFEMTEEIFKEKSIAKLFSLKNTINYFFSVFKFTDIEIKKKIIHIFADFINSQKQINK